MTAKEMAEACREFEGRYKKIASIQDTELLRRDFLYTAQLFGNMEEIIEDYIYHGGKHIDFLFKAFAERDRDWGSGTIPGKAERERVPENEK